MKPERRINVKKIITSLVLGCAVAALLLIPACSSVDDESRYTYQEPPGAEQEELQDALRRAMTTGPITRADEASTTTIAETDEPETGTATPDTTPAATIETTPEGLPAELAQEEPEVPVTITEDQTAPTVPPTRTVEVPDEQLPPGVQPPTGQTGLPGTTVAAVPASGTTLPAATSSAERMDELIPHPVFNFPAIPLEQVLEVYAQTVGKTILRPAALPAQQITLITQTPLTRREAVQALDSVLAMNGITMIPVDDKFVKAVPQAQAFQEGAKFLRMEDSAQLIGFGQYITHIVQLTNVLPSELVQVLQPFAKMPNGLLPIDSTQMLVIRDYTENVNRMLEIIDEVDVSVPLEFEPVVIPIKYALATDIATVLSSLTTGGGGGTVVGSSTRSPSRTTTPLGGTTFPGGNRGGLNQQQMGANLGATPQSTFGQNTAGGGSSFSDRLRNIVSRAAAAGEVEIIGPNKIIADERTNSLLIFATRKDMIAIRDIVEKLDVVLAQVLIEAIIMEVTLDNGKTLGVSAAQRPQQWSDILGAGGFRNSSFTNLLTSVSSNLIGSLPSGFAYTGVIDNEWEVIVTAIANDSRINVLSRPRIQTSHAVPATLFVGNSVPFVTGTSSGFGDVRQTFQNQRVGITLDVLPLINPDGLVVMDIRQEVQQLGNPVQIDGNPVPTTVERNALTKVAVKDRDTIVLGGFISSTQSNSKSGVPFLKDIPLLGALFRSSTDSKQRVELIAMIRPTVLPTPEAAALQVDVEKDRLPGVRKAEVEWEKEEAKRRQ